LRISGDLAPVGIQRESPEIQMRVYRGKH
jgi:hypothetical protein